MSTTLDGVTLAEPVEGGGAYEHVAIGAVIERADGTVARRTTNAAGRRRAWSPRWEGITAAQLSTLESEWQDALQGAVNWSPPDQAGTISVIADGQLQVNPTWKDGAWHYSVSGGRLIEVSP